MNKKPHHKRKKIIVDVIDGKIINDDKALKLSNVEIYIEKNGYKLIKIFSLLFVMLLVSQSAHAEITAIDLESTTQVNILGFFFLLCIALFWIALQKEILPMFYIANIGFLVIGLVLMISGFNPIISAIICIASLIFMATAGG